MRAALLLSLVMPVAIQAADPPPVVTDVDYQPLAANAERVEKTLAFLGVPLPAEAARALVAADKAQDVRAIQKALDPLVIVVVTVNPESRVKANRGPAEAKLGVVEGDRFMLRQYFLSDPNDEEALLTQLVTDLEPRVGWVTYNVRAFDLPLLETRLTMNRQRGAAVFSNINKTKPMAAAVNDLEEIIKKNLSPDMSYKLVGMADVMLDAFKNIAFALVIAVIMVYMILAAQFESFVHPFTIMFSLPVSLIGALGLLLITGERISIFSLIGIIMLMGLVTKNAILLVDYTITLRGRGMSRDEALMKAGPVRLRPIIMTTAAMVFGMLPTALKIGEGAEQRAPMAIAVIGGLITSTLLTLVVIPVVYTLVDDLENFFKKKRVNA